MALFANPIDLLLNRAQGDRNRAQSQPSPPAAEEPNLKDPDGCVSTLYHCQTVDASKLCIYDGCHKLNRGSEGGIGGTYSEREPDFWFHFTASKCHGNNHLLNIFVNQRRPGSFSIQVSDSNELTQIKVPDDDGPHLVLPDSLTTACTFRSSKPNKNHYIKTYCFTGGFAKFSPSGTPSGTLMIPIKIEKNPKFVLNETIVKSVKLQHDLSRLLTKQEETDFILESATHKEFPAQKILLAAHSPVLRNMIKSAKLTSLFIDISDTDMELLLEFIYTGTIVNVMKQECLRLLEIADKFQLTQLFTLVQHTIGDQITVSNAVEVAVVAKKYSLEELQRKVFNFIIKNPAVMKTDAWINLKDVELTKFLFQYMHTMRD